MCFLFQFHLVMIYFIYMILQSPCYWDGNALPWVWYWECWEEYILVTVQVNCLAYVEMNAPKCSFFCVLTRKTYSVTTIATDSQMLWSLLNYFRFVAFTIKTLFSEQYSTYICTVWYPGSVSRPNVTLHSMLTVTFKFLAHTPNHKINPCLLPANPYTMYL
jgi:hypothetical protein